MTSVSAEYAWAIPSPELVIGSVSSLGQILAVVVAAGSGAGAFILRKLGVKLPKSGGGGVSGKVLIAATFVILGLAGLNAWQFSAQRAAEQARLQATLVRPASFSGTAIKDANLKETKFHQQTSHPLAITTEEAANLLQNGGASFFDIRESGENAMGTLPGASHMRYPDFRQAPPVQQGQTVVLFCHNGNRSSETCEALAALGYDCRFIAGGIEKWIVEGRKFSDAAVTKLSDLRAIPEFPNKEKLLSTRDFQALLDDGDLQIVDARYPGDFEAGHLPGAVNIPIRAMPTDELRNRIAALRQVPTVAACYDRRSCFMSQVLALEMEQAGIPFLGRYTTPWEYFIPPQPKPHVQEWLSEQQKTLWSRAIDSLAAALAWVHTKTHLVFGLLALALITRLLILPIAIKSERDQIVSTEAADELAELKLKLKEDSVRRARAIRRFYQSKGLTPGRNMIALLFLPVTMLGVSAAQQAGVQVDAPLGMFGTTAQVDPTYILPLVFTGLAIIYLVWAVAKTRRQAVLWSILGGLGLFLLVAPLNAAANVYLNFALCLLLIQRAYVTGLLRAGIERVSQALAAAKLRGVPNGVIPLDWVHELEDAGNKAHRLSVLRNAGFPAPSGVVLKANALHEYGSMKDGERHRLAAKLWHLAGAVPCAVRSSASNEDGEGQSFAGVFESVLNVDGANMKDALDHVLESFQSARAESYAAGGAEEVNILIQQMVEADYAGVLFTQDPTAPGLCMIEMVQGCGEDLVSGRVTPITARIGRYSGAILDGQEDLPIDVAPLLEMARQIETLFGGPQDIEWVFANGRFQIVQSRDITTLELGSEAETLRVREWQRFFDRFGASETDLPVVEQDEMSEVLPRPTPMSFSVMGSMWAPGGSVDLACRDLEVPYDLPEGPDGHLVELFGKTYVDTALKDGMTLRLTDAQARRLRKRAEQHVTHFRSETLPRLQDRITLWQATDYDKLPLAQIQRCIGDLLEFLVQDIYVEAEKANILAGFTMAEAQSAAAGDTSLNSHLMHAELPHAPSTLMARLADLEDGVRQDRALREMGHRSIFDYELSAPRYAESPGLLWPLLESSVQVMDVQVTTPANLPTQLETVVRLAVELQGLKEQAKHEALRIVAELRRALLAFGQVSGLGELVFHLLIHEVLSDEETREELSARAEQRKAEAVLKRGLAPAEVSLTLHLCEELSMGQQARSQQVGDLGGTCVSGEGQIRGRVFKVIDEDQDPEQIFAGFADGDILVCSIINPAWLPWVQRSGAVLSEVGGWLSHMAIVAREKKIMMLVACKGLPQLQSGQVVTVQASGAIEAEPEDRAVSVA
ncbi:MAG: PEP-utilizing protein [Rhodobacteraceae bacterium]|nr:PEP-utilizing protein [Paracoccaceae bacterium]